MWTNLPPNLPECLYLAFMYILGDWMLSLCVKFISTLESLVKLNTGFYTRLNIVLPVAAET